MGRLVTPVALQLRRAQIILMLAALVPTALMVAIGILLLALGQGTGAIVAGVLVLAFCTTALTGYILGSIYMSRGATVARFQHDFLSSVSHELRTPLTSMRMFIETLRNERMTDPEQRRQCLEVLDQEIQRLNGLVERLISLSRLEARRHRFEREPVPVMAIVGDALAAYQAATLTETTPVELEIVGAPEELFVLGDREALVQAVTNLLTNAWKYGASDVPRIVVRASCERRHVCLAVIDNGPGVPREEQRTIFDHFQRGRAAIDGAQAGSGLGLAIVRAIVRAHGGKIELRSAAGGGAEFRLRLPRARTSPAAVAA